MDTTKRLQINLGFGAVLVLSLIPAIAWFIGYDFSGLDSWQAVAISLAKIGAFGGMAMFALSLILSARFTIYDRLFGGLDKMYIAHRFLGTFSTALLLIHPLALSLFRVDNGLVAYVKFWAPVQSLALFLGAISLYGLLGLVIWTISARIKYETFVSVHRLLGVLYVLGAIHAFMIGSVIASNSFIYWYMLILSILATFSFVAYSLLGDFINRPLIYTVVERKVLSDAIVEVTLKPTNRIINFAPGQFVYVKFDSLESHGYHPFSISSDKRRAHLTLAIRQVGDLSHALGSVRPGESVQVKGPFGGFILEPHSYKKQLWIAGGIGVTPFISGALSLPHRRKPTEIEMIYATDDAEPYGAEVLQQIEDDNARFNVTLFHQEAFGYVSLERLHEQLGDVTEREIFVCGPPPMIESLKQEAAKLNIEHQLHYEEFAY